MKETTSTAHHSKKAMHFSIDNRPTLSRTEAKQVYNQFATTSHAGGKDATSGYGGPAIRALLSMASLKNSPHSSSPPKAVLDYGCGQGKLAELVLQDESLNVKQWVCIDQSPNMVHKAKERLHKFGNVVEVHLLESGEPLDAVSSDQLQIVQPQSMDLFISTYCLDVMSETDMHSTLTLAERTLKPSSDSKVILAGITWGYRDSIQTCFMTAVWEFLYKFNRKRVGGCRPQMLEPYLKSRGWEVLECKRTLPDSFPWMVSEVICARPPSCCGLN